MMIKNILKTILIILVIFIGLGFIYGLGNVESVKDFTLKDYLGNEHSLSDYKDSKAIVIIFVATRCPVSNAYNTRMEKLFEDYKDKDVALLGINSNKSESVAEIKEHAKEKNLNFTILKDEGNVIADMFEASHTPEAYILNKNLSILYHGRIDNSQRESEITSKDLRKALNEILAGKEVSNPQTKAFGCSIKRI
ncbi:thioredoxin family protein [bacterium BMS3Abin03]|nr:thioredoxin family protein [bacterium BMS3Abin03]MCG6959416.1 thioredoxin family protein [bacterium BMS3Abin03]